jgi:MFS transporter, ACDE family, multidrug resistance protein
VKLGAISWRGPFFGVTMLMGIALIATIAFADAAPRPAGAYEPVFEDR